MKKITNPDKFRENVKNKFTQILKNNKYGNNLERGIYNNTLKVAEEKNIVKNGKIYILLNYILINLEHYMPIYNI